ncbi:MAG: hypothetical protein KJ626_06475 [Verrucomicrobia bacterium]|nr:hypothetical protein [Verrucomicrobiota bacterium]
MQNDSVEMSTLSWIDRAIPWILFAVGSYAVMYAVEMLFYFLGGFYHNHSMFGLIYGDGGFWPNFLRNDELVFALIRQNDLMVFIGLLFSILGIVLVLGEVCAGYDLLCSAPNAPTRARNAIGRVMILQIVLILALIVLGCGENPNAVRWFHRPFRSTFPFLSVYAGFIVFNILLNGLGVWAKLYMRGRLAREDVRKAYAAREAQAELSLSQRTFLLGGVSIVLALCFGGVGMRYVRSEYVLAYQIVAAALLVLALGLLGTGIQTFKHRTKPVLCHSAYALGAAGVVLLIVRVYSASVGWLERIDLPYESIQSTLLAIVCLLLMRTGFYIRWPLKNPSSAVGNLEATADTDSVESLPLRRTVDGKDYVICVCPSCSEIVSFRTKFCGMIERCPKCDERVEVPEASSAGSS